MEPNDIAALRDKLTGALIGLARATEGNEDLMTAGTISAILEGLAATADGTVSDGNFLADLLSRVTNEKRKLIPLCFDCAAPCGRNNDYDLRDLQNADPEARAIRWQILSHIRGIAAHVHETSDDGNAPETANLLIRGLVTVGIDFWGIEKLRSVSTEIEAAYRRCIGSRG
ncbi:MAG: hypothetical protein IJX76_10695 [Clostridia bacterium]|nr:hypothetical protein [Clostridia bacterium]